jgi:uncharacterized protein (DUF2236 family)
MQPKLTDQAIDGLDDYITRMGIPTRTAFFEAMGLAARDGRLVMPEEVLEQARQIAAVRRSRPRKRRR